MRIHIAPSLTRSDGCEKEGEAWNSMCLTRTSMESWRSEAVTSSVPEDDLTPYGVRGRGGAEDDDANRGVGSGDELSAGVVEGEGEVVGRLVPHGASRCKPGCVDGVRTKQQLENAGQCN
jgi:hypothetical protein